MPIRHALATIVLTGALTGCAGMSPQWVTDKPLNARFHDAAACTALANLTTVQEVSVPDMTPDQLLATCLQSRGWYQALSSHPAPVGNMLAWAGYQRWALWRESDADVTLISAYSSYRKCWAGLLEGLTQYTAIARAVGVRDMRVIGQDGGMGVLLNERTVPIRFFCLPATINPLAMKGLDQDSDG